MAITTNKYNLAFSCYCYCYTCQRVFFPVYPYVIGHGEVGATKLIQTRVERLRITPVGH